MGYDAVVDKLPASSILEVHGNPLHLPGVLADACLAVPTLPNTWSSSGDVITAWVGQRRWLIFAPMAREEALSSAIAGAGAVVLSDAFTGFSVDGPQASEIMAQASPLDVHSIRFPEHGATFTSLFGQTGLVLRQAGGFACHVDVSIEDYMADRFSRCNARLGPWFRQYRAGRA